MTKAKIIANFTLNLTKETAKELILLRGVYKYLCSDAVSFNKKYIYILDTKFNRLIYLDLLDLKFYAEKDYDTPAINALVVKLQELLDSDTNFKKFIFHTLAKYMPAEDKE